MLENGINSHVYNTFVQNQVSDLLAYFNDDLIYDTVNIAIDNQHRILDDTTYGVNLVESIEQSYKKSLSIITDEITINAMNEKRDRIYYLIINCICSRYNLSLINEFEIVDLYSLASVMYDFFVSGFRNKLIKFYSEFIYKKKNNIYINHLTHLKKEKNISMLYGRKVYKNNKLAIINANIEYVMDCISGYDISFEDILSLVYPDKSVVAMMVNNIATDDFFKNQYSFVLRTNLRYRIISEVSRIFHMYSISEN